MRRRAIVGFMAVLAEDAVVAAGGPANPSSSATAEADALRLEPDAVQPAARTLRIVQASLERGQSGALIVEPADPARDAAYDAIARSLGCSADSARAHVFQALKKIRQNLAGNQLLEMEMRR